MRSTRRDEENRGYCSVMFMFYGNFVLVETSLLRDIRVSLRSRDDKNDGNQLSGNRATVALAASSETEMYDSKISVRFCRNRQIGPAPWREYEDSG